ncbi:MAG: TonB-dependent receptor [Acidobacteria bacterium]|nr:TonB-dependent receptor [Acidobacteriota bacterium]
MKLGSVLQGSRIGERLAVRLLLVLLCLISLAVTGLAQNTNSADIRGTVTDATGAVVPGVSVTILNVNTGVKKALTTNEAGIYDAVSLVPGRYQLTFSKEGFSQLVRGPLTLDVAVISVDAQLGVGTTQQQIEVTTDAPLLRTETAEQSMTLKAESMSGLPNVGQDWQNFTKLLPGASGAPSASQGAANPGAGVSVNGNLPFYANFLADGASTSLPHSANTDVSIFETVSELQINTSTFSAQYGIGGIVFNQISKGGTNQWHGAAYEYFKNNALNARDFFAPKVAELRYNQFGGSIGGPIVKNKMFFFYDFDKTINNSGAYSFMNVPTNAMRVGDFSGQEFSRIFDPATRHNGADGKPVSDPFAGNRVPLNRMDQVALNYQQYFPLANLSGYSNNYTNRTQTQQPFIRHFGRLDYDVRDNNRLTFSITQRDNPAQYWWGPIADILQEAGDVSSTNAQISDVWTVSPSIVNEFRFGYTRQGNWFSGYPTGKGYPEKIGIKNSKADIFPGMQMWGGPSGWTGIWDTTNAIYIEHSFTPSDVVTMIRGRHILHFGGEVLIYRDNSTPWGNLVSGDYVFSGAYTQAAPFGSGGLGYADFLLGQSTGWNALVAPMAGARQKSPQFFFQDDIKLRPNLTLNIGLRYQIQGGWSEVDNHVGTFDPTLINPATKTAGAMWFAPASGRDRLQASVYNIFLPRLGFAYSPKKNWTVRGGFGTYSYNWSLDTYTNGAMGYGSASSGNAWDGSQVAPVATLSGANANLPWIVASRAPDGYNGQGVSYMPYNTPVARNYQWSVSVQHQIGNSMLAEAAYVASHGTGLSFPVDINQIPAARIGPGAGQSARPFPQYNAINGNNYNGISNFNSLQLQLRKRLTRGLSFDVNYTWEKFMDNQDSAGWGSRGGTQPYQSSYNPAANYARSNFDVPHMFKGDVVYELPFGKGRTYLNQGGLVDALIGGWQASTIFIAQAGAPFTLTWSGNNNSGALAGQWFPNVVGNWKPDHQNIDQWYNPAAFAQPAAYTFGNLGRNAMRGPGLSEVDFSMGKAFRFPSWESARLHLRFDASNVVNHPSFGNPAGGLRGAGVRQITSTTVSGRTVQLGARFSF